MMTVISSIKCYLGIQVSGMCGVKSPGSTNSSAGLLMSIRRATRALDLSSVEQGIGAQDLGIPKLK